jgi:hypothetical protein
MSLRRIVSAVVATALVLGSAVLARAQKQGQEVDGRVISLIGDTLTIEWQGKQVKAPVTPKVRVVFHRDAEYFPDPTIADIKPGMNVSFIFDSAPPERIHVNLVPPETRRGAGAATRPPNRPSTGGAQQELMVKILEIDERRGELRAQVGNNRQTFTVDDPRLLRRWQEGDVVIVTVNGNAVTDIKVGGLSGRVVDVDRRRGEIRIDGDGRTTTYVIENNDLFDQVRVGDKIRFEIAEHRGRQVIVAIH